MRKEEAAWLGQTLTALPTDDLSPLIELGSSTLEFRTVKQPHVDALIHAPLRAKGVRVVHSDLKMAPGVDISGDFYDPKVRAKMKAVKARSVLCCNMFEHVTDRAALASVCDDILQPGGLLVVTVPYSYPIHYDPIDTNFRPTPEEIAALFPGYKIVESGIISSATWGQDFLTSKGKLATLRSMTLGLLTPWKRYRMIGRVHRLKWAFRPFKVSCVVLRKPA